MLITRQHSAEWFYRKSALLEAALIVRGGMDAKDIIREFQFTERILSALIKDIRTRREVLTLTRPTRYEVGNT